MYVLKIGQTKNETKTRWTLFLSHVDEPLSNVSLPPDIYLLINLVPTWVLTYLVWEDYFTEVRPLPRVLSTT